MRPMAPSQHNNVVVTTRTFLQNSELPGSDLINLQCDDIVADIFLFDEEISCERIVIEL